MVLLDDAGYSRADPDRLFLGMIIVAKDPFFINSPTCISFSGGRTSAYMLWRVLQANNGLPDETVVCFANTGKEEEATLVFVQECSERWNVPITWVEYRDDERGYAVVYFDSASRNGEPFASLIRKKNYLPNPVARFCTSDLKVTPINKRLKYCGLDADMMVGVRADEPRRVSKLHARGLLTPLVSAGVTQDDVQTFWRAQPFDLDLPFRDGVTALGNCDLCFLKGPRQIRSLITQRPARAVWWAQQEQAIGARFRSDRPSYAEMAANAKAQVDAFGFDDEAIACFCGE